jgi:predicted unusual protein kinase regulating ubiquinone biosynthesis (AarF/ABC1/UbiB family)
LVQEFVTGLWLWEVIAAVEQKDPAGRALLQRLNIDPELVGRRILWAEFWSGDENVFFHADPHPANILVRRNSELTFVDFGSCGSFNNDQRIGLEQMILSMNRKDVEGMTRGLLSMMEPLPPVDLPALVKHSNEEYMRVLQTFDTPAKYTEYWERTSARQWIVLLNTSRKFNVPLSLHTLRMIRATLLYDSIVLRLDNTLDRYEEYNKFMKDRAQLVKRKWRARLKETAGDGVFLGLDDLSQSFSDLVIKAQTTLSRPLLNFGSNVKTGVYTASVLTRMIGRILLITLLGMALVSIVSGLGGEPVSFASTLGVVTSNRIYQVLLLAVGLFSIRNILFRLRDRDV